MRDVPIPLPNQGRDHYPDPELARQHRRRPGHRGRQPEVIHEDAAFTQPNVLVHEDPDIGTRADLPHQAADRPLRRDDADPRRPP